MAANSARGICDESILSRLLGTAPGDSNAAADVLLVALSDAGVARSTQHRARGHTCPGSSVRRSVLALAGMDRRAGVGRLTIMASAPLRPCASPGCPELVRRGRCAPCARAHSRNDQARRGSSRERGYSWAWQKFRARWLRSRPYCGDTIDGWTSLHSRCRAEGRVIGPGQAEMHVDHSPPVSGPDDPGFFDESRMTTLCAACHAVKTFSERRRAG
ncbi:hypothetical protein BH18ACI5_BH18ACI5_04360 [soil metagenome]